MAFWRRTGRGIERAGGVLADAAGVHACLRLLRDSVAKVVPPEHQAQLLQAVGLTAATASGVGAAAGVAVAFVAFAGLIVCRVNAARAERQAEQDEQAFQNRVVGHLQVLEQKIESVLIRQAALLSADRLGDLVRQAVATGLAATCAPSTEDPALAAAVDRAVVAAQGTPPEPLTAEALTEAVRVAVAAEWEARPAPGPDAAVVAAEVAKALRADLARQAAETASPEQLSDLVQAAVREEFATQRDLAAAELGLTPDEARDLTTQLGIFAADLQNLSDKIDLVSNDVRHRPWLELRRPMAGAEDLFLYRDMVIPFVGRDEEWARLTAFLEADRPFSWWRVIDAGGAGKSRLAQELCWHAFADGWTAGFLQPTAAETWSRWRVTNDTLIVVDYVFARWDAAALGQILDEIARYPGPHRVRLLVLERSDYGSWWRTFAKTAGVQAARAFGHHDPEGEPPTAADRSVYGDPLTLPPLGRDALGRVLGFVLREREVAAEGEALEAHVKRFLELDPKGRPLFAAFYADAVSRDPHRPDWSLVDIARSVLDQKILRQHPAGEGQAPVTVDARHLNLLVLATLVGGVARDAPRQKEAASLWEDAPESVSMADALAIPSLRRILPAVRDHDTGEWSPDWDTRQTPLIAGYGGEFDDADPYVPELQPDPLGEALVIMRLAGRATAPDEMAADANRATEALLVAAGDLAPRYLSAWIDRAHQDYPDECAATGLDLRAYQRLARWSRMPDDARAYVRLQSLDLDGTQVSDVSPLSGLTALQTLSLTVTQVSDLSPLSGLTALQRLYLSLTRVSDVSPLSGLTALQTLDLRGTHVSDVSPLSRLTALQTLSLGYTQVSDVSPLAGLPNLTDVRLPDGTWWNPQERPPPARFSGPPD